MLFNNRNVMVGASSRSPEPRPSIAFDSIFVPWGHGVPCPPVPHPRGFASRKGGSSLLGNVDRRAIVRDRLAGLSLTEVAKKHRVSRATVCRLVNESGRLKKTGVPQDGNQVKIMPLAEECNSQVAAQLASHKQPAKLRDSSGNHLSGCGVLQDVTRELSLFRVPFR